MVDQADKTESIFWAALEIESPEGRAAYLDEARTRDDLEILTDLRELPFDAEGNLPDSGCRAQES